MDIVGIIMPSKYALLIIRLITDRGKVLRGGLQIIYFVPSAEILKNSERQKYNPQKNICYFISKYFSCKGCSQLKPAANLPFLLTSIKPILKVTFLLTSAIVSENQRIMLYIYADAEIQTLK